MKQKELKLTTKISMVIFALMTIISPILLTIGILTIDTPNTASPEIMILVAVGWFGYLIYCDNKDRKNK